jgi:hypothetical protein
MVKEAMTAEVAVMNRVAVALAADSAVTLERGQTTKIFQSENKLFELSHLKPVGLMIYQSTQFFGVPWEVIIKEFRRDKGDSKCAKLFDWAELFRQYMMDKFQPSEAAQAAFAKDRMSSAFTTIYETFIDQLGRKLRDRPDTEDPSIQDAFYRSLFNDSLKGVLGDYELWEDMDTLTLTKGREFVRVYKKEYDERVRESFFGAPSSASREGANTQARRLCTKELDARRLYDGTCVRRLRG